MAKGYWIGMISVTNAEEYAEYVQRDTAIVDSFGGKFLVRGGQSSAPEIAMGERQVVVEFPDYQTALDCYNSDAYQEVMKIRVANATGGILIVEGVA